MTARVKVIVFAPDTIAMFVLSFVTEVSSSVSALRVQSYSGPAIGDSRVTDAK